MIVHRGEKVGKVESNLSKTKSKVEKTKAFKKVKKYVF